MAMAVVDRHTFPLRTIDHYEDRLAKYSESPMSHQLLKYLSPRFRRLWTGPIDVDPLCNLVRALDMYRQPDFDVTKANRDLSESIQTYDARLLPPIKRRAYPRRKGLP